MARLRWGVLSTARIGRKVVPGIAAAPNCEVVAIGSRDEAAARAAAAELGIGRAYGSYEAVLADPEVDAVYVPLPNHLHATWTVAAARAGKHVLCEKPLALTAAEAEDMVEACDRAGVALMEAFMYRHHPSWQAVHDLVAGGRIGEIVAIQSWFSFFNDDPANIRNILAAGGGALYDIGCYCVSLSRWLMGGEPDRVGGAMVRDPVGGTDTVVAGILGFGDRLATFTASTRAEDDQRVDVYGTRGRVRIEIPFNIPPDRETRVFVAAGGDPPVAPNVETLTFPPADPYTAEATAFAAAVLAGRPVPVPPADAVANLRVIDALFGASEAGAAQSRAVPSK
jgi:predicted dehydrogenase